jgi:uncharacterized membrane protein
MRKSMLPRELEEILKAYEKSNKCEMKREELRSYCWYLPTDVFEYAIYELVQRNFLEIEKEGGKVVYRLKKKLKNIS